MVDASTFGLFTLASLAILAIPGPAVIYVLTRAVAQGRSAGFVSVLGVETGTLAYALAAAAGLTALIAASEVGFTVVKFAGAGYLIYLGIRKLRERPSSIDVPSAGRTRMYVDGLVVQVLNPKIAVFFLAFLPQFVDAGSGSTALQILLLGVWFTVLAILSDGLYVLLAGGLSGWLRRSVSAPRRLARASGAIYIGLGLAALSGSRPATA